MENSRGQFQQVYNGPALSHKVNKLGENARYRFRVCAANAAGQGPFSRVYEYATAYAIPPPLKSECLRFLFWKHMKLISYTFLLLVCEI